MKYDDRSEAFAYGWAVGAELFPPVKVALIVVSRGMIRVQTDDEYDLLDRVRTRLLERLKELELCSD